MKRCGVALLLMLTAMQAGEIMPAPHELLAAKKAYLEDRVGDTKVADRVYAKIKKWGRWQMVSDESEADIVIVLANNIQNLGAMATGQTLNGIGSATAIALYSDKRFLAIFARDSHRPLMSVTAEAWITPGSTASHLVDRLRDRVEQNEGKRAK